MTGAKPWLALLMGIGSVALVIVSFVILGEPPTVADDSADKIVDFYVDNKDSVQISALLAAIGSVLFAFFATLVYNVLRTSEGDGPGFAIVALVGTAVFATGIAIDSMLLFVLAESADDANPIAIQSLEAIWDNDFFPFVVGTALFSLGNGIAILRTGGLPKWLGWVAVVAGVVALTPVGFVGALIMVLWIIVTSIVLARGGATA